MKVTDIFAQQIAGHLDENNYFNINSTEMSKLKVDYSLVLMKNNIAVTYQMITQRYLC